MCVGNYPPSIESHLSQYSVLSNSKISLYLVVGKPEHSVDTLSISLSRDMPLLLNLKQASGDKDTKS